MPSNQKTFDTVLRWMTENLEVASGIYRTPAGRVRVDPALVSDQRGRLVRRHPRRPKNIDAFLLNSGAALIACCYIDALGKVLRKGAKPKKRKKGRKPELGNNLLRFRTFVLRHMPDFMAECQRRGGRFSVKTLYNSYRNGFVHQFATKEARWGRRGPTAPYWSSVSGRPSINIDRLVCGVIAGIADFRVKFPTNPNHGKKPYENFVRWLGA